jgi:hypothetical protein
MSIDFEGLYSYKGEKPDVLPNRIRLSNGLTKTDRTTFTEEDLEDAGYTGPHENPDDIVRGFFEKVEWNSETVSWEKTTIPELELMAKVRLERNNGLELSDWTQLPDSPLTEEKREEWAEFRQKLRDLPESIPSDATEYANFIWPQRPE